MEREGTAGRPALVLVALLLHIVLYVALGKIEVAELVPRPAPIEVELVELPPTEAPPPTAAPEPPPPAEPPAPEPPPPKPEKKVERTKAHTPRVRTPPTTPPPTEPTSEPPPAAPRRFELPADAIIPGSSGSVKVAVGSESSAGGSNRGTREGSSTGKPGGQTSDTPGTGTAAPWQPVTDVSSRPGVLRVPELQCPAVVEQQVAGTVVLLVQVQRDGTVRSVKVVGKMGYGCDEIARKALRRAKFAPATDRTGVAVDYELRYEYEFVLQQ